jgi:hypothetical protein
VYGNDEHRGSGVALQAFTRHVAKISRSILVE